MKGHLGICGHCWAPVCILRWKLPVLAFCHYFFLALRASHCPCKVNSPVCYQPLQVINKRVVTQVPSGSVRLLALLSTAVLHLLCTYCLSAGVGTQ